MTIKRRKYVKHYPHIVLESTLSIIPSFEHQ